MMSRPYSVDRSSGMPADLASQFGRNSSAYLGGEGRSSYAEWFTSYAKPPAPPPPQVDEARVRAYRSAFTKFPAFNSLHTAIHRRLSEHKALTLKPCSAPTLAPQQQEPPAPPFLSFLQILESKEEEGLPLTDDPVSKLLPISRVHKGKSLTLENLRNRVRRRARMGTVSMGAAEVNAMLWDSSDSDVDEEIHTRREPVRSDQSKSPPPRKAASEYADHLPEEEEEGENDGDDNGERESDGDSEEEDAHLRASFLVRTERHFVDFEPEPLVMPVLLPTTSYDHPFPGDGPRTSMDDELEIDPHASQEEQIHIQSMEECSLQAPQHATHAMDDCTTEEEKDSLGVDPTHKEKYLTDDEFLAQLQMTRDEFYALPPWKQRIKKQEAHLF